MSDDKDEKTVSITVNSVEHHVPKGTISHATIVSLAFPGTTVSSAYIVKYTKGEHGNQSGVLAFGSDVSVKNGMSFRVASTGES
jgi:Multiubiquitin